MAKQSSSAEKSATKQPAKQPPTSTSMGGVAELAPEALGVFNAPSLHGQADRLGNTNLQAVQRQMLANRIGQTQGNGHLQQIVAFSRQQAPYQSNIVHRSPVVRHDAREQAQPTQESIADEQLAEIWGIESGLLATSANPTPKPTGTTVSVQRAAEAETLPTEAEKAAARAKAAAAEARAEQTSNQGRAQTDQARASQAAEQTTGQAAKQKASSARTAAAGKKAAPAKEIAVNGAGPGIAQQERAVDGGVGGTLNATNGNQAKAPASAAEDPGFQSVVGKVKGVADQEQTHAPAATKAKEAQAAAESPASELAGKAQSGQVEQMDAAETPGFNAAAFKQKLMARIEALTPKNAADADEFKEKNKAGALKGELQNETAAQKEQSQAPLAAAASQTPNTGNVEPKATTPLAGNPAGTTPALAGAEAATPKPKGQGEVEAPMQAQSQQLDQQMADASVTQEQLAKSNEPEFQSAVTAKTESQANAQTAPQAYRQDEQGVIQGAQAEATATVQGQTSAMHAERTGLMAQVDSQQVQGKSADEQKRAEVGAHIQTIYDKTKSNVEQILTSLDSEVDQLFNQGAEAAKQSFENYVEAKMDAYKEKRYGGMLGWAQWLADKIQPTQPEVFAIFAAGRDHYIAQMGAVIDNVVALIGRKLAEAKAEIASGKQEIQEYVSKLPADLQQVGQEAAQNIQSQFDELTQSIDAKQDELIDTLANKYNEKLQAVDARIEQLKAENETIYDKAANAIDGVIKTIQQLKQMMASILARAQSAIELIAADPIGFLGKLIDGVKLGLNNFMGNIGKHLETGFVTWLTGTVSKAGITLPDNWDLPGIFQLVMQLLGLGFDQLISRVSQLLGFDVMGFIEPIQQVIEIYQAEGFTGLAKMGLERLIGKEHMESLMHVWGIVQNVISGKWAALWGMLQEFLGNLKEMVFDQIIQYISEQVIKGGITWMLSLFNPVGAFIKACKAIYDIIMFFVNNGKQIMALVDAVINSVGAIATGNISAAATAIENALAKGIPVAIGFLASLLNLGDIGEKVQKIIQSVRGVVDKALNAVFNSKPVQMVAGFIKKLVGKIKGNLVIKEDGDREKQAKQALLSAESPYVQNGKITRDNAEEAASKVTKNHLFQSVTVVDGGDSWDYHYVFRSTGDFNNSVGKAELEQGAGGHLSIDAKKLAKIISINVVLQKLSHDALIRIISKRTAYGIKGQLLEELMGTEFGKNEDDVNEMFIPGHEISDLSGRQLTDGMTVAKRKDGSYEIKKIYEAKAGKAAARGLGSSRQPISKMSDEDMKELREEAFISFVDSRPDIAHFDSQYIWKNYGAEIEKYMRMLNTPGEGQFERNIERLDRNEDDDAQTILVKGRAVRVVISPSKVRNIGVVPKDVNLDDLSKKLRSTNRQFEVQHIDISQKDLTSIANRIFQIIND